MEAIDKGLPELQGPRQGQVTYDPSTDYPAAIAHADISSWLIGEQRWLRRRMDPWSHGVWHIKTGF